MGGSHGIPRSHRAHRRDRPAAGHGLGRAHHGRGPGRLVREPGDDRPAPGRGGTAGMEGGPTVDLRVERVEEPRVFGFTWHIYGLPEDDPRRTYVEFTLEPTGAGTRLTVVESGFAQLPEDAYRTAYEGNTRGWASELGELVVYLDAA